MGFSLWTRRQCPATSTTSTWERATDVLPPGVQVLPDLLPLVLQAWWKAISPCIKRFPPHKPSGVKGCRRAKIQRTEPRFVWRFSSPKSSSWGSLAKATHSYVNLGQEWKQNLVNKSKRQNKSDQKAARYMGNAQESSCFTNTPLTTAMPPWRSPPERSLLRPLNPKKFQLQEVNN